ncbi:uncharacterized protein LOC142140704 isoform X1 [Mixophyes fleayi]|uniref:uncharacterized protein LOC142140704 isoform X1 n=1 Tax=Mixophyes fleayi TaxID=3061075 RepID=UPI003F4DB234
MHFYKDQTRISEYLHHSLMKNKDNIQVTGKILNLTLEIIFLLTGEDFVLTKKQNDQTADSNNSCLSDRLSSCQSPITEPPSYSLAREVTADKKSVGLNKATHSASEEVPVRYEDVAVYLSVEEWEYLEGHKEHYKNVITEGPQPPVSAGCDGVSTEKTTEEEREPAASDPQESVLDKVSCDTVTGDCSSRDPPERCETPVYSPHCIEEENRIITQDSQAEPEAMNCHPPCKEEAVPAEISSGECSSRNPPGRCETPVYSPDCIEEEIRIITQDYQAEPGDEIFHPQCKEEAVPAEISSGGCSSRNPPERCETPVYSPLCTEEENRIITQDYQAEPADGMFHPRCKEEAVPVEINSGVTASWKVQPDSPPRLLLPVQVHHNDGPTPSIPQVNILSENSAKGRSRKSEIILDKAPALKRQIHFTDLFKQQSRVERSSISFINHGIGNQNTQKNPEKLHVMVYKCRQCRRSFGSEIDLVSHQRTHSVDRVYTCAECPQSFTDNAALVAHQWTFHRRELGTINTQQRPTPEDKPFSCTECGRSFTKKSTLVKHQRIHTGAFACPDCGKCLSDKTGLILHRRTHTGEKPFACSECGRRFTQMCHLVTHQSVHTGERPFSCSECGKCFSVRSVLTAHQAIHARHKTFACPECGKSFTQKAALATHRRVHLKEPGNTS